MNAEPMANPNRLVSVTSSDSEVFRVKRQICGMSTTLNNLIRDLGLDDPGREMITIPIANVDSETFKKVLEWCEKHVDDPAPTSYHEVLASKQTEWDVTFFGTVHGPIFKILLAADYLDIPGLLNAGAKAIAETLRDKNTEEMREILGVKNDFTPEEEAQIRRENTWTFG